LGLVVWFHFILLFFSWFFPSSSYADVISSTLPLFYSCLSVYCVGLIYLYRFYSRTVRTVFNSIPPPLFTDAWFTSLYNYYLLLRPLAILFRMATHKFRILPSVMVIGEVRCGTTTMSQHLSNLPGCVPPFCPWKHPELDNKETFYFVNHYGTVDPDKYAMCFPLAATRWFWTSLGYPYWTFDGCAQYLTNPMSPHLVRRAYGGRPRPLIIAMTRDPVSQACSWWKYEQAAMAWGQSMGLTEPNAKLRTREYWSATLCKAVGFGSSELVRGLYEAAENVALRGNKSHMPDWAMTFPGGQLTGVVRCTRFTENVRRWCIAFGNGAGPDKAAVTVLGIKALNDPEKMKALLRSICSRLGVAGGSRRRAERLALDVDFYVDDALSRGVRRNRGGGTEGITAADIIEVKRETEGEKERLESWLGEKVDW